MDAQTLKDLFYIDDKLYFAGNILGPMPRKANEVFA
jgi:hypothetical protein